MLDDSSDPDKGAAAAKKLAADPNVVAVVGPVQLRRRPDRAARPRQSGQSRSSHRRTRSRRSRSATTLRSRHVSSRTTSASSAPTRSRRSSSPCKPAARLHERGGGERDQGSVEGPGRRVRRRVHRRRRNGDRATDRSRRRHHLRRLPRRRRRRAAGPRLLRRRVPGRGGRSATAATAAGIAVPLMGGDGINDPAYITGAGPAAEGAYASGVGVPLVRPSREPRSSAPRTTAAGIHDRADRLRALRLDATNVVIAALRKPLAGKQQLPSGIRKQVVARLQATDIDGVTGAIVVRPVRRHRATRASPSTAWRARPSRGRRTRRNAALPGQGATRGTSGRRPRCCRC